MANKEVQRFLRRMDEDKEFSERINRVASSDDGSMRAEFWTLVREAGFDFTADDLAALAVEAESQSSELSDDELENVAGGTGAGFNFYTLRYIISPGVPGDGNPFGSPEKPHFDGMDERRG